MAQQDHRASQYRTKTFQDGKQRGSNVTKSKMWLCISSGFHIGFVLTIAGFRKVTGTV